MGARERRKGAAGERELRAKLAELLPGYPWERSAPMQAGNEGHGDVDGHPMLHIECKRGKATPQSALKQALAENAKRLIPRILAVAITRQDRGAWMVSMRLEDFMELVRAYR